MAKNIALSLFTICLLFFVLEAGLRLTGFKVAYSGEEKFLAIPKPDSFFVKDNILGWRLSAGNFYFFYDDSAYYKCLINIKGNRITKQNDSSIRNKRNSNVVKKIYLYGCSFTFGQSVPDSSTYPYYLQSMLTDFSVCNKGVPGYSPVQMYLSLVNDVNNGDKPNIVVINYGTFQDERSVLGRKWLNGLKWAYSKSNGLRRYEIDYPYAKLLDNDSISIEYLKWRDWSKDLPLSDMSALVNLVNNAYNNFVYKKNKKEYDRINLLCLYKILNYCKENGVQAIYYGLTGDSDSALDSLASKGAVTKLSSVDIGIEGYNCSPIDPWHPNAKADRIYAQEVFDCLVLNKMIE